MKKVYKPQSYEQALLDKPSTFKGWDFSRIESSGRMREFPLRWNYYSRVKELWEQGDTVLDMGTGGGESLSLFHPFPGQVCATEGYEPNVNVAKDKLEPMGVQVSYFTEDECLPYQDEWFELVMNKHESYDVSEVARILRPDGIFVTQQVGGLNDQEINARFDVPFEYAYLNAEYAVQQLSSHFDIRFQDEEVTKTRFYDLGALIYYLEAIPWQIPDFSIQKYDKQLREIYDIIVNQGYFDCSCHRFIIAAMKK
ncbi:class I SAM-dependent methyltransferase [Paenibacillus sp. Marseille-Q4541]|uniref:class I SAM-dependent methyltransferase n=1 Tax=Paenibacillus sp. Marseille-Q4541 TaxID=2831522 RepID=UPI001BA7BCF9|nr:class I SAM-dependent methyltransferase [Paenibacillus sp. Marseille-Q4541]